MPTSLHASVPSASSRALKSGSTDAFATSFEPPDGPIDSAHSENRRWSSAENNPFSIANSRTANQLEDFEFADLRRRLDGCVSAVVVIVGLCHCASPLGRL